MALRVVQRHPVADEAEPDRALKQVLVRMWPGVGPGPGADVAEVGPVLVLLRKGCWVPKRCLQCAVVHKHCVGARGVLPGYCTH